MQGFIDLIATFWGNIFALFRKVEFHFVVRNIGYDITLWHLLLAAFVFVIIINVFWKGAKA